VSASSRIIQANITPRQKPETLRVGAQEESAVMQRQGDEVLTTKQVADEMKVSVRRVLKWIKNGELVATDLGRDYRIYRSDLEAFVRQRRTRG
jgi:excisionase family DNA binding protein